MPSVFDAKQIQANIAASAGAEKIRCQVFLSTIESLEDEKNYQALRHQAQQNLRWWQIKAPKAAKKPCQIEVHAGDWGVVTRQLTEKYGEIFAVLNMANACGPGGGVSEGMIAQEENMFRRTDCYRSILPKDATQTEDGLRYIPKMTALINGEQGEVYLDTSNFRICFKGPEAKQIEKGQLGYKLLANQDLFPFYELRAAAIDCRWLGFNKQTTRHKIKAQLETLKKKGIRNAVLSAFGCGAFLNPPEQVAQLYKEEIEKMKDDFDHLAFAIYYAGYGPQTNFEVFERTFALGKKPQTTPAAKPPASHFLARHWGKLGALALSLTAFILAATVLSAGLALVFIVAASLMLGLMALKTLGPYLWPAALKSNSKPSSDTPQASSPPQPPKPKGPAQALKKSASSSSLFSPPPKPRLKKIPSSGALHQRFR